MKLARSRRIAQIAALQLEHSLKPEIPKLEIA
jgi:hypothetical protein